MNQHIHTLSLIRRELTTLRMMGQLIYTLKVNLFILSQLIGLDFWANPYQTESFQKHKLNY